MMAFLVNPITILPLECKNIKVYCIEIGEMIISTKPKQKYNTLSEANRF